MQGRNCCLTVRSGRNPARGRPVLCGNVRRHPTGPAPCHRNREPRQWPPRLAGATDGGMRLARQWGHKVVPIRPVLAPLLLPGAPGLCTASQASACLPPYPWAGALSATRSCSPTKGSAAPPSFRHPASGGQGEALHIDFLPDHPALELMHQPEHGKSTVLGLFKKVLPTRLAERLIPGSLASRKVAQLAKKDREYLALAIHDHMVTHLSRSERYGTR